GSLSFANTTTVNIPSGKTLSGSGTLTVNGGTNFSVTNSGTVAPGLSPGILTISGNYTQNAGGSLNIEIGGLTVGTQYDQLVVTGNATLAGTLNATLINGFTPG